MVFFFRLKKNGEILFCLFVVVFCARNLVSFIVVVVVVKCLKCSTV